MYKRRYGILETKSPLHVGASAGEETGNLNLIFRDQFTQTGIVPGSSIRGRFRADIRRQDRALESEWFGQAVTPDSSDTTEAKVKFEYASLVWLPVFCPGQPIVWVTCPWLLRRYQQIKLDLKDEEIPAPYTASSGLVDKGISTDKKVLFFNLGFLEIETETDLDAWVPDGTCPQESQNKNRLVVVDNNDMGMIHDMALYRQSRVKLADDEKKVDGGAFFNVEALPEASVLVFPIALRESGWKPFGDDSTAELYFGGLESIGFGRCQVSLSEEQA
ncbi:type III-B CRISPR module RAMP protein Cmr4 [filamentous cyanobacterium LEGE 11480]|uniref:Type III-B CRISPR module RAMP protein Cmr4 n=1 Tax=Romeriopsis navalis LEGE 11480 TaxID=2777977 RepID=A0A928VQT9_9CYAN|nr:RAMP superfamily CRISPR-associated protein [Romeriopsis navalis]MBE9030847.1 type III-B CRISPR module RAMP protein Cmr4 [Romeriopsis navalis LEGE 11480]